MSCRLIFLLIDEIFSRELDFEAFSEKIFKFFLRIGFGERLERIFLHESSSEVIIKNFPVSNKIMVKSAREEIA